MQQAHKKCFVIHVFTKYSDAIVVLATFFYKYEGLEDKTGKQNKNIKLADGKKNKQFAKLSKLRLKKNCDNCGL